MKTSIRSTVVAIVLTVASLVAGRASAHIGVTSPGFANTTQEISFSVGHGCTGADTYRVRIEIPAGVTSLRTLTSDFGRASVEKDAAGIVTAVVWQKPDADLLDADTGYYRLVIRAKLPDQPFTTLYFPAHQTCKAMNGTVTVVDWVALPTATPTDAAAPEPAPAMRLLPARRAGWNKYVVAQPVPDLSALFGDALIVWKGISAYSANPATLELIKTTAGVTELTSLTASDEIWVKY